MAEIEERAGKRRGNNLGWAGGGLQGSGGGAVVATQTGAAAQDTAGAGAAERAGAAHENVQVGVDGASLGAGRRKDAGRAQQPKGWKWWQWQQEQPREWRGWKRPQI